VYPIVHVVQAQLAGTEGDLVEDRRVEEHGVGVLEEQTHLAAEAARELFVAPCPLVEALPSVVDHATARGDQPVEDA
jgi:hypothetical protein